MAQNRRARILSGHTASVVRHTDKARAAAHDLDLDRCRTRIHRIFDQLLYDRGRPLNHLACRDLVDGCIVQYVNPCHPSPSSFRACSCRR